MPGHLPTAQREANPIGGVHRVHRPVVHHGHVANPDLAATGRKSEPALLCSCDLAARRMQRSNTELYLA